VATERAIYRAVTYTIELVLAACCWLFGVILLAVPDVFAAPLYQVMAELMGQRSWGALFAALGIARLAMILFTPRHLYAWRRRASMATLILCWFVVWISFWYLAFRQIAVPGTGAFLPGMVLAPAVASHELVCWMVLTALNARGLRNE
jgi:hypothetical protein